MMTLIGLAAAASLVAGAEAPADLETIRLTTEIAVAAPQVWDAVRDVYAVDTRLVPGMVTKVERDGEVRKVTFANGFVVTERIIEIDDKARRMSYAAFGGEATHHHASMEVAPLGRGRSRITWTTRFLPVELRPFITRNMQQGLATMKAHLEATGRP